MSIWIIHWVPIFQYSVMFVKFGSSSSGLLGGVISAILAVLLILAVILILILLTILLFIICRQRKLKYETGQKALSLYRLRGRLMNLVE